MNKIIKAISFITSVVFFIFISLESTTSLTQALDTTNSSYRTEYVLFGDINNDNELDAIDIMEMRNMFLNNTYSEIADLNNDKIINSYDLTLLNNYVLGQDILFDSYLLDDADEDNVCDLFEAAWFNTNPDSADTDEDTISDYDEIVFTRTSPINKYTRNLSVTDAKDDYDGDKLSNIEELSLGIDPQTNDTDYDTISDYDEIKKYNTNPMNVDSDEDGINDIDEIKLELNPNNSKTDGAISDNKKTFRQNISSDNTVFSNVNSQDSPYTVSIDITAAGIAENNISVYTGEFSNATEDERIKGKSVSFSYNENLQVDSAKIHFTPTSSNSIENYMVFEYFPETNYFLPVESKYTESSVYTETTSLGTYCLVDISEEDIINNKNTHSFTGSIVLDYELGETEVAFLVDISGSIDETALEETKKSIRDFSQALFEHSENSYITIIGYYLNPVSYDTKIVQYTDSDGVALLNSTTSVDVAISKLLPCTNSINNDLNAPVMIIDNLRSEGLFSSDCKNKYAFILSDSTYTMTNNIGYKWVIPDDTVNCLNYIHEDNIHINYILSAESYSKSKAVANLKKVCEPLGFGVYSKTATGNFAVNSFASIYSDAIIELKAVSIAYTSSLNANTIPEKVERNAFINSLPNSYDKTKVPDADTDGNIDFKEATIKIGAAQLDTNGNLIFPSLYDACDISESTRIGLEQFMMNKAISDKLISGAIQITPFSDKILYEDSDGDGIINKWDASPDEPIDANFLYVDNVDKYTIDDIYHSGYLKNIERANETYDTVKHEWYEGTKTELYNYIMSFGGCTAFSTFVLAMEDKEVAFGATPFGARSLIHYLNNSGKDLNLDPSLSVGIVKSQRKKFYAQMNSMFELAESTLKPGMNYSFITTKDTDDMWAVNFYSDKSNQDEASMDWWLAVGGGRNGMKTTISCTTDTINNKYYTANIDYYIYDFYDWDEELEKELADLHKFGKAKSFRQYGSFSFKICWIQGSRYPATSKDNQYGNIDIVEFNGIDDDSMLSKAYNKAKDFYSGRIDMV